VERALQLRTSGKAEERLEGLFELVRLGHVPSFRTLAQEIADEEGTFLVRAMEVTLREAPVAMRRRLLGRMAADLWRHLKLAPLAPALGELLGHESPELAADAAEALAVLGLPESVTAYADWLARLAPESPGFPRALAGMGRFPGAGAAVAFVGGLGKAPDAARRRDLVARWTARDQAALRALETFVAAETAPGVRAAALARLIARGAGTKEGLEALLPALAPDDLAAALEAFRDAPGRVTPRLLHAALESADPAVRLGAVGLIRDGEPPPVSDPDTLARLGRVVEARIREGKGTAPAEEAARTALAILARARAPGVPRWCDRLEGEPELLWSDTVAIARVLTGDDRGEDPLWRRLQRPEAQERILEALSRLAGPVPPSITGLSAAVGGARSGASTTSRVLAQQLAYRPRQEGAPGGLDVTEDLDPWVVLEQAVRRFGANRREGLPLLEEVLDAIPAAWPEWCQTRLLGEARTGGLLVSDLGELRDLLDREPRAMGVVAAGLARLLPEFLRTGPPQVLLARPELWLRAEGESVPGRALEGLERIEELRRRTREAFAEAARHWGLQPGGERGVRLAVRGLLRFQDGRTREALRTLVPRGTHSSNFVGVAARLSGASSTVFQASGLVAR
jgi:hypothetical protein